MYTKENINKDGKVISYRFITSYKDPLTNNNKKVPKYIKLSIAVENSIFKYTKTIEKILSLWYNHNVYYIFY